MGLITLMVFATKLSKYFKRMDLPEGVVGEPNEFEAAYTADNSKTLENPPERRVYTPKQTPERAYTPIQRPTKRSVRGGGGGGGLVTRARRSKCSMISC